MDLSKVFDSIPYDLIIAGLHAYGLRFNADTFLSLYLKYQKQNVRIKNKFSAYQNIISGVLQGLYYKALYQIQSFLIYLKTLEQKPESAVSWLKQNEMIVNADNVLAII